MVAQPGRDPAPGVAAGNGQGEPPAAGVPTAVAPPEAQAAEAAEEATTTPTTTRAPTRTMLPPSLSIKRRASRSLSPAPQRREQEPSLPTSPSGVAGVFGTDGATSSGDRHDPGDGPFPAPVTPPTSAASPARPPTRPSPAAAQTQRFLEIESRIDGIAAMIGEVQTKLKVFTDADFATSERVKRAQSPSPHSRATGGVHARGGQEARDPD